MQIHLKFIARIFIGNAYAQKIQLFDLFFIFSKLNRHHRSYDIHIDFNNIELVLSRVNSIIMDPDDPFTIFVHFS